jgi:hypothetical protein
MLAQHALGMVARLFRHGKTTYHGGFISQEAGRVNPLQLDLTAWTGFRTQEDHGTRTYNRLCVAGGLMRTPGEAGKNPASNDRNRQYVRRPERMTAIAAEKASSLPNAAYAVMVLLSTWPTAWEQVG